MGHDVVLGVPRSARSAQRREETMASKMATKAETAPVVEVGGPSRPTKIPKMPMNTRVIIPSPAASDVSERSEVRNPREKRAEAAHEQPVLTVPDPAPHQPEVPIEPKEKVGPSVVPDILVQEGGRVSMTIPKLLGVIQIALARERLTWSGSCEGKKETLPKVHAPKKWSDVDLKRPM